jgi:hypothetical protein
MKKNLFNNTGSLITFLFSLFTVIMFWKFVADGDVFDNWYPLVGSFVASHGALIGIVLWQYFNTKDLKETKNKNKVK